MAWLSDSLQGRQSNPTEAKSDLEWREGEYDPPANKRVNKRSYGSGRTLLAWRRLMVIRRFMPDDPMRLSQTIQNAVGSAFSTMEAAMTSEERRKVRHQRRRIKRETRKAAAIQKCDCFEQVFTFDHLYHAYKQSRKGVTWKASTQKYVSQAVLNIERTRQELMNGTFRSTGFYEFDLMERGKPRHIRSVNFNERVVQRCLCDFALIPILSRTFIYDNGASIKNKGYHFAIRRLCVHLRRHYQQYGTEGYILLFDFSKFFDRISHEVIRKILAKELSDERLIRLTQYFVDAFGDIGLGSAVRSARYWRWQAQTGWITSSRKNFI